MASVDFAVADIFSDVPFRGNPLAVVDTTSGRPLSTSQQQLITRQFNLSETTFILPATQASATYRLRSFLPDGREVFGAGHNILGAWWHLAANGLLDFSERNIHRNLENGTQVFRFQQELGEDTIPVLVHRSKSPQGNDSFQVVLRQAPPQLHGIHPNKASLAKSFGLTDTDIGLVASHSDFVLPPQVASTSTTHHLLVPLGSVDALNRAVVQKESLLEQLAAVDKRAYGLFLFTRTGNQQYEARFFSPGMSGEDPATGSAAGPLSVYLHEHGELKLSDGTAEIEVRQGLQVGRDCLIKVVLSLDSSGAGGEDVRHADLVGGGVLISKGTIKVPDETLKF
ncbi:phenazine biosynthesis protein [Plectosphaerella cucumerina]|uniref:Phenazine biosynthesis protein n=1 Tax=Plectosphaerella cucumerina TaxID=40658 RepID=A0A8K0X725_9PEZI|nr:phenazine biosynthesis protein [Plectosphaerella cucumerina]